MKKYLSYAIALAAVLTVACNKENPSVDQPGKGNTGLRSFTAYVDGADSKTVFGDSEKNKKQSLWSGIESIKVLSQGKGAVTFTTSNIPEPAVQATFNIADDKQTLGQGPWFAVYPHATNPSWEEGTTVTGLSLNPQQNAVAGSYDPANHFAIAYTENETLSFKNLVSFIKVTIEVAGVSEVCIFGNSNETLAGNFTAQWNEGDPKVSEGTETYAKITGKLTKGSVYYIACLPRTFENGFTLEAVINGTKFQKKSDKKNYTLARNKVLDLGEVSAWPSIHSNASGNWETTSMKREGDGIYKTTLSAQNAFEFKVKFVNEYKNNDGNESSVWARPVSNKIVKNKLVKEEDDSANLGKWYNIYKGDGNAQVPAGNYDVYVDVHNGAVCFVNSGTGMPEYKTHRALHILCEGDTWQYMHRWQDEDKNWEYTTTWAGVIKNTGSVNLNKDDGFEQFYTYWPMEPDLNGQTFEFMFRKTNTPGDETKTAEIKGRNLNCDIFSYSNSGGTGTYTVTPVNY